MIKSLFPMDFLNGISFALLLVIWLGVGWLFWNVLGSSNNPNHNLGKAIFAIGYFMILGWLLYQPYSAFEKTKIFGQMLDSIDGIEGYETLIFESGKTRIKYKGTEFIYSEKQFIGASGRGAGGGGYSPIKDIAATYAAEEESGTGTYQFILQMNADSSEFNKKKLQDVTAKAGKDTTINIKDKKLIIEKVVMGEGKEMLYTSKKAFLEKYLEIGQNMKND